MVGTFNHVSHLGGAASVRLLPPVEVRAVFALSRKEEVKLADYSFGEVGKIIHDEPEYSKLPIFAQAPVSDHEVQLVYEMASRLHAHRPDGSLFIPASGKERVFLSARMYHLLRPCFEYCQDVAMISEFAQLFRKPVA